jgi:hypothetical protein
MAALPRYALGSKAPLLERASEPKRTAMLTAVMRHLEAKAIDETLDLFQVLMAARLLNTAKRKTEKERLSTLPLAEKASRLIARAWTVLVEELELVEEHGADLDPGALWAALEEVGPRAAVTVAAATVVTLVPEDENTADVAMRAALATRYATVRPFLALLGESKALGAASAGKRVLAGVRGLPALARRKVGVKPLLPGEVDDKLVPPVWRKAVYANLGLPQGSVDRDAYVVCVLEQLHRALNNRDVFASPSPKRLPHPLLHRWLDEAEPLSSAFGYRRTANIRRRNDLPGRRPARFLATGDAPCTFNPIYGQGMAVAAMSAVVLRETLSDPRRIPTTRRVQQALLTASRQAWGISAGSDRSDAGRGGQCPGLRAGGPRRRLIPAARPGALPR